MKIGSISFKNSIRPCIWENMKRKKSTEFINGFREMFRNLGITYSFDGVLIRFNNLSRRRPKTPNTAIDLKRLEKKVEKSPIQLINEFQGWLGHKFSADHKKGHISVSIFIFLNMLFCDWSIWRQRKFILWILYSFRTVLYKSLLLPVASCQLLAKCNLP